MPVVNISHAKCDVYIGRGSKWGNPFSHIGSGMTRTDAIASYESWIKEQHELMAALPELRGKVLGCYCKPLACHGDVLDRMANEDEGDHATDCDWRLGGECNCNWEGRRPL